MSWTFDRTGDHLALDFANTLGERLTEEPIDHLGDFDAVVEFALQTGLITRSAARAHRTWADRHPRLAARVHATAVALREALFGVFTAVAGGEPIPPRALDVVNEHTARLRLDDDLAWTYEGSAPEMVLLGPVVTAAIALLTAPERDRVHICGAPDCPFLFLDRSKNRSRRWCDMAQCGNRMKARRHHARHRDG